MVLYSQSATPPPSLSLTPHSALSQEVDLYTEWVDKAEEANEGAADDNDAADNA
jgi:transcription elongation factor Elf1